MKEKKRDIIVNIGRQYGSGGRIIGEKIAEKLAFPFYDRELLNMASKESGLSAEFFEKADEKNRFSLFGNFLGLRGMMGGNDFSDNYLTNENLFLIQSEVIHKIAENGSAVFVGRCADYILRDHPDCINIFISADIEDRIKRVCNRKTMEHDKAVEMIEKTDKKRADYYNYYTNKKWGFAKSYHLCINSSTFGVEGTIQFLINYIEQWMEERKSL